MNKYTRQLFRTKHPYDKEKTMPLFLEAITQEIADMQLENESYQKICNAYGCNAKTFTVEKDLEQIPVIPTLFFKRNDIQTKRKSRIEVTSSGTSGTVSRVNYTFGEIRALAFMAIRLGKLHHLFSIRPTRYIMLGYEPTRKNQAVISKTAFLSSLYAPAICRTYALRYKQGKYQLELEQLMKKIVSYAKGKAPVRLIGFPSYTYFLLQKLKQENLCCKLPKGSKLLLGGGWKQFAAEEVEKETLYKLVEEVLGVKEEEIQEFYGAAEHPVLYCTCKNHHFHIPAYGAVLIRDPFTNEVLPKGESGLVNLLTPMRASLPLFSIMTDDLGVVRDGKSCGCGIETDYVEILGRVGVEGVKTCSAGAKEYLEETVG